MPNHQDPEPNAMSFKDAYTAIRNWYQSNVSLIESIMGEFREKRLLLGGSLDTFDRDHSRRLALIRALPPTDEVSDLECRAVFDEVIGGVLECGIGQSDGPYKMAAYVRAAMGRGGHAFLGEKERAALRASKLWPYLSCNRDQK